MADEGSNIADSRNTVTGFSTRALKNLQFMYQVRDAGFDVHIVTHLIVSLLGLIIFPHEFYKRNGSRFLEAPYSELVQQGWPPFNCTLGDITTIERLIWHLRNACSHHRIHFSSESRVLSEVQITFSDRKPKSADDNWRADINGKDFAEFVAQFAVLLGASTRRLPLEPSSE